MPESGLHPWEQAWKEGRWEELSPPLSAVVDFVDQLRNHHASNVLDLGCGAGRHTILLAKAGFQVMGLDVSQTALKELQERLAQAALTNVTLVQHEMRQLPFLDEYFDALVCTNVLHHGTMNEIRTALKEARRVMKPHALGLVVTLSKNDFRYGTGDRLEPDTYRFTEGEEKGIVHHFFAEAELHSAFSGFKIENLREELITIEKGDRAHFFLHIIRS